jgi:hypothetical protein
MFAKGQRGSQLAKPGDFTIVRFFFAKKIGSMSGSMSEIGILTTEGPLRLWIVEADGV